MIFQLRMSNNDSRTGTSAQHWFNNPTPRIRLLSKRFTPPTFATISARSRHFPRTGNDAGMLGVMKLHDTDCRWSRACRRVSLAETMPRLRHPIKSHLFVIASKFSSCEQFRVIRLRTSARGRCRRSGRPALSLLHLDNQTLISAAGRSVWCQQRSLTSRGN